MMLRHLLKLTWKRKSRNLMLSLEILVAFAIVFGIAAVGLRYLQLYQQPLGFDGTDVWKVDMQMGDVKPEQVDPGTYDRIRRDLLELPQVRAVSFATFPPYTLSTWTSDFKPPQTGATVESNRMDASDDVAASLGMRMVAGRWFNAGDEGAQVQPAVLNRRMATALFPGRQALGQRFTHHEKNAPDQTLVVVGLIDEFRNKGPFMTPTNYTITRFAPHTSAARVRTILIKLAPGTPRTFEAQLNARLKLIRNDWGYQIEPLKSMRASLMKEELIPLAVMGVIAAFMLLMVAFGLFGVLWQNTTRRIPEIGLRRAVGASAAHIYRQIVAEQLLLSSVAIAVGLVLLVQLPVTGALGDMLDWTVFGGAAALSMGVIYLLSLLCALYPGWRASRLDPSTALHYE
jgi:putative ABC transport system permease protein